MSIFEHSLPKTTEVTLDFDKLITTYKKSVYSNQVLLEIQPILEPDGQSVHAHF